MDRHDGAAVPVPGASALPDGATALPGGATHGVEPVRWAWGEAPPPPSSGLPVWAAALIGVVSTLVLSAIVAAVAVPVLLDQRAGTGALSVRLPARVAGHARVHGSYVDGEARSFAGDARDWARSYDTAGYGRADDPQVMVYAGALRSPQDASAQKTDLDDAQDGWREDDDDPPAQIHDVAGTEHLVVFRCADFEDWVECVGTGEQAYVDVYVEHEVDDAEQTALDLGERAFVRATRSGEEPGPVTTAAGR